MSAGWLPPVALPAYGRFHAGTDLSALLRQDASGELHWRSSHDPAPPGAWLADLVAAEEAHRDRAVTALHGLL